MSFVTVSSKFQIVVPKEVREHMSIRPGEKLAVVESEGLIHLVPLRGMKSMRGFVKGVSFEGLRDESERFD
ncbi:MAG: AbrB/MazE/SpoVT family DNA-binding domain-containing protein [Candidatus Altiarchaeota archaeon]